VKPICVTCGTQFEESAVAPDRCPVCQDERQFVGLDGQQWTTFEDLRSRHEIDIVLQEKALTSFSIEPQFGIGQRAFLLQTSEGNILWDCLSLFDDAAADHIRRRGGLQYICISHPHYYAAMVEWSREFGNVPIYLHRDDAEWVMRKSPQIEFWSGETKRLLGGVKLVRCGGHFPGGTVLYWPAGAEGKGALFTGDIIQVAPDRKHVGFMWSYPNWVPLGPSASKRVAAAVSPHNFDRIYGAFPKLTIATGGKQVIADSLRRHLHAMSE
jgi:glyoxylase-like metal-dependent hydrolase (beta-lactamase superfamily II)